MAKEVQIKNSIFTIPTVGENRWGEKTTALLEAMATLLANIVGPQDILVRESVLANNVTAPTIVNGLRFDTSVVESSKVEGVIIRSFPALLALPARQDTFTIESCSFEGALEYSIRYTGTDAGVKLIGNNDGQFTYTSEDVANTETIFIKFYGKAIVQEEE